MVSDVVSAGVFDVLEVVGGIVVVLDVSGMTVAVSHWSTDRNCARVRGP